LRLKERRQIVERLRDERMFGADELFKRVQGVALQRLGFRVASLSPLDYGEAAQGLGQRHVRRRHQCFWSWCRRLMHSRSAATFGFWVHRGLVDQFSQLVFG